MGLDVLNHTQRRAVMLGWETQPPNQGICHVAGVAVFLAMASCLQELLGCSGFSPSQISNEPVLSAVILSTLLAVPLPLPLATRSLI